jgi:hypothetical protein
MEWVGLTPCTGGVIVWYAGDTGIVCRKVTLNAGVLLLSAEHPMYVPLAVAEKPDKIASVQSDGANIGWMVCRAVANPTSLVLLKFNFTTFTADATLSLINTATDNTEYVFFALTYFQGPSGGRLAVHTSDFGGTNYQGVHNPATLAANWSQSIASSHGPVAALPSIQPGRDSVIFAQSVVGEGVGIDNETKTIFSERTRQTGTSLGVVTVPWYGLQSTGAAHRVSNQETYPYFPLFPRWGGPDRYQPALASENPSDFMDTPQIVVVTPGGVNASGVISTYTPVMRCAVDRLSLFSNDQPFFSSSTVVSADGKLSIVYTADRYDLPTAASSVWFSETHYCIFDLASSGQPATAADVGPVAAVGSGLVAAWDGLQTTEYAPFTRPKIAAFATSGFSAPKTGLHSFTAVLWWRDQAGNIRRSAPALPVTLDLDGEDVDVYVPIPLTMRNGVRQADVDVGIYGTVPGGVIFHSLGVYNFTKGVLNCWKATGVPNANLADLQIYSMGGGNEPLLPECPPPAQDVRSIAGRLWLIDGENRYRLLPSLLKQQGVAIEFNSNLEIIGFDQQYGKLVAVVDVGGNPIVLAERGIWRVDGYGPDNAGMGGSFTDPQLVSNIGCRSRLSVAQVPNVGVLFQCNDGRFALLTGGGVQRFETFGIYEVGPPTVHLLQSEVIYPLADGSQYIVYNWLANGWTKWPTGERVLPSTTMIQTEERSRTYYYASDGSLLVMDSDSIDSSPERQLLVERGWVAPAGPQGDCVIREFWVHVIYNNPHSVRVKASFDYDTTSMVAQAWTNAELVPLLQDGRYTIGMNCEAMPVRAVRVTVVFTPDASDTGEGGQPLTLTVTYGASQGIRRRTLMEGAIK